MIKKTSTLGSVLSKSEQQSINGGLRPNVDGLVCHDSDRFTSTTCPGGTTYSSDWNACCYHFLVSESLPIEN